MKAKMRPGPGWFSRGARAAWLGLLVAQAGLVVGCGTGWVVGAGISDYESGDYEEALENFDDAEKYYRSDKLNDKGVVRYLTYRGLTHYKLYKDEGKTTEKLRARRYLRQGARADIDTQGDYLDEDVRKELEDALRDLGEDQPVFQPGKAPDGGNDEGDAEDGSGGDGA